MPYRLLWDIPVIVGFFLLIKLPLIIIGWLVIPSCAVLRVYDWRKSRVNDKTILAWSPSWMWIWGNEEDGILNGEQFDDMGNEILQIIYWSAWRNPANNLRYVPYLGAELNKDRVRYVGTFGSSAAAADLYDSKTPLWFYCWDDVYANVYILFSLLGSLYKFRIGWKVFPTYIKGIPAGRLPRAGFAAQLKRVAKRGEW